MYILIGIFFYYFFTFTFHYSSCKKRIKNSAFLIPVFSIFSIWIIHFYKNISILYFSISLNVFIYLFSTYLLSPRNSNKSKCKFFLMLILSPDLLAATRAKSILKEIHKTSSDFFKAKYILYWNYFNFCCGIIFYIILSIYVHLINSETIFIYNKYILYILFAFLVTRCYSRAFELIFAFYKDITDSKRKNPLLKSNRRISLATKSYVEVIFNFATVNFFAAFLCYKDINLNLGNLFSIYYNSPYDNAFDFLGTNSSINLNPFSILLRSFGNNTFTDVRLDSFFSVLQILTTLVLVLFALAGYLNNKGDNPI